MCCGCLVVGYVDENGDNFYWVNQCKEFDKEFKVNRKIKKWLNYGQF